MINWFKPSKLSEDENEIKEIVNKYLEKEGVDKLISPISEEYFLMDTKNEIYICLSDKRITISNHKFLYKNNVSLEFSEGLKKQFRERIEVERQELKAQLFKNETDLLKRIKELVN